MNDIDEDASKIIGWPTWADLVEHWRQRPYAPLKNATDNQCQPECGNLFHLVSMPPNVTGQPTSVARLAEPDGSVS